VKVCGRSWKKVKWYGNKAKPYCDWECWKYKRVVLHPGQWPDEGWSYVRRGATSEYAHSGFLPGFTDLKSAMTEIDRLIRAGKITP